MQKNPLNTKHIPRYNPIITTNPISSHNQNQLLFIKLINKTKPTRIKQF